ncbi:hypothetical protein SOVF_201150 [Spinacia oleracea]|nr:hypothetical protein SOVF_201150 [Spinacia oleracea]
MLELTVISAQGLKNSSLFTHHLKPFITITTTTTTTTFPSPPSPSLSHEGGSTKGYHNFHHVYSTRVDDEGGFNPTWGDKFHLPIDPTFFTSTTTNYSCVYLQLYTKRALLGPLLMGWIQITASDIFDGHFPLGSAHHLSYRLRKRDGSRGHGVVNVVCKFVGEVPVIRHPCWSPGERRLAAVDTCKTVIGTPVTAWPMRMKDRDKMGNVTRTNE